MTEQPDNHAQQQQPPRSDRGGDWHFRPAADHGLGPLERLRSTKREQGLISWTLHLAALAGLRTTLALLHGFRIEGREHLPAAPPFVMIANHTSHLDALVMAAALPRRVGATTFPVAAGDVFFESAALSAATAVFINALPLWRKKATGHALEDLRSRLLEGQTSLILFPEGARSRDGQMLPFKSGIGRIVAGTSVPVVPCWLGGAFEAFRPGTYVPRPRRITLRVGPPVTFADQPQDRAGYDAVSAVLREAVEGLRGREPACSVRSG